MMLFGSWWGIDKAAGSDRRLSRLLLDEPGGSLGEDQADQRGDDDKNHGRVQHGLVDQPLAGRVHRRVRHERDRQRGSHLWDGQREHQVPLRATIAEPSASNLGSKPLSAEQGAEHPQHKQGLVAQRAKEDLEVDQEAGGNVAPSRTWFSRLQGVD